MLILNNIHISILKNIASTGKLNWPVGLNVDHDCAFKQLIEHGAINIPVIRFAAYRLSSIGKSALRAVSVCHDGAEIALPVLTIEQRISLGEKSGQVPPGRNPSEFLVQEGWMFKLWQIRAALNDAFQSHGLSNENLEYEVMVKTLSDLLHCQKAIAVQPPANAKWKLGDTVQKKQGSSWRGKVVGFYSTEATPIGYSVESAFEKGSVQVWPEAALADWADPAVGVGSYGDVGYTADDLKAADPSCEPTYQVSVFKSNEHPFAKYKWVVYLGRTLIVYGHAEYHAFAIRDADEFIRNHQIQQGK